MGSPTWARTSSVSVSSGAPGTRRLYQAKRPHSDCEPGNRLAGTGFEEPCSEGSGKRILTANVIAVVLCRIAVDQRATEERVLHAAHLVFDGEEDLVGGGIDNVTKSPFVAVGLPPDAFHIH